MLILTFQACFVKTLPILRNGKKYLNSSLRTKNLIKLIVVFSLI